MIMKAMETKMQEYSKQNARSRGLQNWNIVKTFVQSIKSSKGSGVSQIIDGGLSLSPVSAQRKMSHNAIREAYDDNFPMPKSAVCTF